MREELKILDDIRLNFDPEGLFVLNITLAFIMFGVALGIKVKHFKDVFNAPKLPIIGFISQFFVLPAVTFGLMIMMKDFISPAIAMGMILVASCPGGNISNFISSLSRGNVALSVTLTAIATVFAIILTPFNFSLWGGFYTNVITHVDHDTFLRPLEINPYQMFKTVFMLLGIPLIIGMYFNHRFPKTTEKIIKPIKILSIIAFIAIVVLAFKNNYDFFVKYIKYIFLIVLLHNGIALLSGNLFAHAFRISGSSRRTITIETGIQNSGLALVLLFNEKIFPADLENGGMVFIAAWWGIWHILSGLTMGGLWSLKPPKS